MNKPTVSLRDLTDGWLSKKATVWLNTFRSSRRARCQKSLANTLFPQAEQIHRPPYPTPEGASQKTRSQGRAHTRKLTCARILLKAVANADTWTVKRGLRMLWTVPLLPWPASEGAFARRNSKWRLCQRSRAGRGGGGSVAVSEAHLIAFCAPILLRERNAGA